MRIGLAMKISVVAVVPIIGSVIAMAGGAIGVISSRELSKEILIAKEVETVAAETRGAVALFSREQTTETGNLAGIAVASLKSRGAAFGVIEAPVNQFAEGFELLRSSTNRWNEVYGKASESLDQLYLSANGMLVSQNGSFTINVSSFQQSASSAVGIVRDSDERSRLITMLSNINVQRLGMTEEEATIALRGIPIPEDQIRAVIFALRQMSNRRTAMENNWQALTEQTRNANEILKVIPEIPNRDVVEASLAKYSSDAFGAARQVINEFNRNAQGEVLAKGRELAGVMIRLGASFSQIEIDQKFISENEVLLSEVSIKLQRVIDDMGRDISIKQKRTQDDLSFMATKMRDGFENVRVANELAVRTSNLRTSVETFRTNYSELLAAQIKQMAGAIDASASGLAIMDPYQGRDLTARSREVIAAVDELVASRRAQVDAIAAMDAAYMELGKATRLLAETVEMSVEENQRDLAIQISAVVIAIILFAIVVATLVSLRILKRSRQVASETARIDSGDLDTPVTVDGSDELTDISRALDNLRERGRVARRLEEERSGVERLAQQKAREETLRVVDDLELTLATSSIEIATATDRMRDLSVKLKKLADEVGQKSTDASRATETVLEVTKIVTEGVEELAASASEISRQSGSTLEITRTANETADRTVKNVQELMNTVGTIVGVVDVIRGIADQTNLLALNATIEAARAGEAGRGFAVVANEVKGLATQTGSETRTIADRVDAIRMEATQVSDAISAIADGIAHAQRATVMVSGAVEQQSTTTVAIASKIAEANQKMMDVSGRIEDVNRDMEILRDVSRLVEQASAETSRFVETLKTDAVRALRESPAGNRRRHERHACDIVVHSDAGDLRIVNASLNGFAVRLSDSMTSLPERIMVDLRTGRVAAVHKQSDQTMAGFEIETVPTDPWWE
jgi:methyl-accepting chemotaxis protein